MAKTIEQYQFEAEENGVDLQNWLLYVIAESQDPDALAVLIATYSNDMGQVYDRVSIQKALMVDLQVVIPKDNDNNQIITDICWGGYNDAPSYIDLALIDPDDVRVYNASIPPAVVAVSYPSLNINGPLKTPLFVPAGESRRITFSGGSYKGSYINIQGFKIPI